MSILNIKPLICFDANYISDYLFVFMRKETFQTPSNVIENFIKNNVMIFSMIIDMDFTC